MRVNEAILDPKVRDTTNSGLQALEVNSPPATEIKHFRCPNQNLPISSAKKRIKNGVADAASRIRGRQ
jgi:hypothetical protein